MDIHFGVEWFEKVCLILGLWVQESEGYKIPRNTQERFDSFCCPNHPYPVLLAPGTSYFGSRTSCPATSTCTPLVVKPDSTTVRGP